jgi:hypothetical protein
MKHVRPLSRRTPVRAALWQEILCQLNIFIAALLGSFGGASPFLAFIEEKCDLPS